MRNNKIFCKCLIMIFLASIMLSIFNISEAENVISTNEDKTMNTLKNDIENEGETNQISEEPMILNIESIQIDKFEPNKEISLPITVKNAESLCGGTLSLSYSNGLTFLGLENKNEDFSYKIVNNEDDNKVVITFSGKYGFNEDITLGNIKFKLPEQTENDSYYFVTYEDETTLLTSNTMTNSYELENSQIYIKKGKTKFSSSKLLLIILIIILLILIVLIVRKKIKKNK